VRWFDDPEYMAVLARSASLERRVGLVLFGTIAGARQVVKVHAVVGPDREVLEMLLRAVRQMAETSGERMIVCELPEDAAFALVDEALGASGYAEEGRVPDFVRDGVALRMMVCRA
jgi:hypothetical protein